MNPRHYGSNPADMRIRIQINPEMWIRILDQFWLRLNVEEVCCLWVLSSYYYFLNPWKNESRKKLKKLLLLLLLNYFLYPKVVIIILLLLLLLWGGRADDVIVRRNYEISFYELVHCCFIDRLIGNRSRARYLLTFMLLQILFLTCYIWSFVIMCSFKM